MPASDDTLQILIDRALGGEDVPLHSLAAAGGLSFANLREAVPLLSPEERPAALVAIEQAERMAGASAGSRPNRRPAHTPTTQREPQGRRPMPKPETVDISRIADLTQKLYEQLEEIARRLLKRELTPALEGEVLVNEALARLIHTGATEFSSEPHLMRAVVLSMQRVMIDEARRRAATKRSGHTRRLNWEAAVRQLSETSDPDTVLDVHEALQLLERQEGAKGLRFVRILELQLFGGMTINQIATALGVSEPQARKEYQDAKARIQAVLLNKSANPKSR